MQDSSLSHILYWTVGYGMFALLMISGQPRSFVEDLPSVGAATHAAQITALEQAAAAPSYWQVASAE